jgi:hypothetical protein
VSDLEAVCQHYETNDNLFVTHEKTLSILADLGFLNTSSNTIKVQEDIWKVLKKTEATEEVKVFNIKVLLTAVLNYNYPWMKAQEVAPVEGEETKPKKRVNIENIGSLNEEGSLQLLDEEITWISKHFLSLHTMR